MKQTRYLSKKIVALLLISVFAFILSTANTTQAARLNPPSSIVSMNNMFKQIAKNVMPSIVLIKVTRMATARRIPPMFRHFFRRFRRGQRGRTPRRRVKGVGSGVIISKKGYIVTNYHVIKGATGLSVQLVNNQEFKVKVVGKDEETDIAVLKMLGDLSKIKATSMGNSDKVKPGEIVFALGNPFGLRGSITQGIVSATARQTGAEYGYDFIQTDAAINPGNSGGALINIYGEVIGINRMIYTRTGGYMGIGFAIPINRVKDIVRMIIKKGRVTRGYLGIMPANPDDATSRRMNLRTGVKIAEVMPGSPAEKAGLKPWDIILRFNGKKIKNFRTLKRVVSLTPPGRVVSVIVKRGRRKLRLKIKLINRDLAINRDSKIPGNGNNSTGKTVKIFGMVIRNLTRSELGEYSVSHGVVVKKVIKNTPAYNAGIQPGDIILEIESLRMSSISRAKSIIDSVKERNTFQMRIKRGGRIRFIVIER